MDAGILKRLSTIGRPVKWLNEGLKKKDIKPYVGMGLLEYTKLPTKAGNTPKRVNAVKLTNRGLAYLKAVDDESLSLHQEIVRIRNTITKNQQHIVELKDVIKDIFQSFISDVMTKLDNTNKILNQELTNLDLIEKKFNHIQAKSMDRTTTSLGLEIVREAFYSNKKSIGATVELKFVIEEIMQETGQSIHSIKSAIKDLYINDLIELYEGRGDKNYGIRIDDHTYNLIKVD